MSLNISPELMDQLQDLCTQREVEKDIRDSAQARYDDLNNQIGALLAANDLIGPDNKAKVELQYCGISFNGNVPRSTINAELLAAQGVTPDVIAAATKTTYSSRIDVRFKKAERAQ